jgi:signal transduction histidine kinase
MVGSVKHPWNKPAIMVFSSLLVLLIGYADYATGTEMALSIFYLLPIYIVTWRVGTSSGVVMAIFCILAWVFADRLAGTFSSHTFVPYWNMMVRLGFFLVTIYLLAELKNREMRRRNLERIFFHDVLNVAGSIRGFAQLLRDGDCPDRNGALAVIHDAAVQIVEEIEAQRDLSFAEHHELEVKPKVLNSLKLIGQTAEWYRNEGRTEEDRIVISGDCPDVTFVSDQALICRILGNMVKNALEATSEAEKVVIGCRQGDGMVEFWVKNPGFIPLRIQKRIFRKSISAKGAGRGLGTYSMKLLAACLNGQVSFTSSREEGTIFRATFPVKID